MADLWILDAEKDATEDEIKRGCAVGTAFLSKRGFTVDQAFQAVLARANNERHNPKAAAAWDATEDIVFAAVWGDNRDDWPDDAVLDIAGAASG